RRGPGRRPTAGWSRPGRPAGDGGARRRSGRDRRRRGRRRAGRSPLPGPAPPPGSPWRHTIGGPHPVLKHVSIRDTMPRTGGPRGLGNRGEGGAVKRSLWAVVAVAAAVGSGLVPATAGAQQNQGSPDSEIGGTADTIRVAVVAGVDHPVPPGPFPRDGDRLP